MCDGFSRQPQYMPEETAPVDSIIVALWTMRHVPQVAASLDPSATALALEIRLAIGQRGGRGFQMRRLRFIGVTEPWLE
jgi:hypothetical protein